MRKFFLVCVASLVIGALNAQKLKETDVPQAVKLSFIKSYPNVKSVKWSKESQGEFEAEFKNGGVEQSANYDATGNWLVTETEIKKTDLPPLVQATLRKEFNGFKVEEAEKVENPTGIYYEVEVEKGELTYSVELSKDGKVLKKEEKKEEDREGDKEEEK